MNVAKTLQFTEQLKTAVFIDFKKAHKRDYSGINSPLFLVVFISPNIVIICSLFLIAPMHLSIVF